MKRIFLTLLIALSMIGVQRSGNTASTNQPRQVLIEAVVVEAAANHADDLDLSSIGATPLGLGQQRIGPGSPRTGFALVSKVSDDLDSVTAVLARDARLKILQRPRILTSHAVPARLFVGETLPGPRVGADRPDTSSETQPRQVGLTFEVTPSIQPDAGITLELHFRNERIERERRATPAGPVPVISISEAQAKVHLRDREAILLAGLGSGNTRRTMPDLLFPKDLPVPGSLSRRGTAGRELLIIVRPTLMAQ